MHSQGKRNNVLPRRLGACLPILGLVLIIAVPTHSSKSDRHHAPRSHDVSALACKTCIFPNSDATTGSTQALTLDFTDKWIYFLGDVTLRQMYGEVAATVLNAQEDAGKSASHAPEHKGGKSAADALEHKEHTCVDQGRKIGYQPPPFDPTPCHLNQKNCTRTYTETRLGANITITYAWKHLIYEDFDRLLFKEWENNQTRPDYLFLSPGGHDCYHEPKDVKHHVAQIKRLASHATELNIPSLVWVDTNPITTGAHGAPALTCIYDVNAAAHKQAADLGFYMFSRQAMILSGQQVNEQGHYPAHQPDHVVKQQVEVMLAWLSGIEGEQSRPATKAPA